MILGVGHPCTGTGYTAKTLQKSGLKVGHERVAVHGIVSWALAAPLPVGKRIPFTTGLKSGVVPWDSAKVIHVARNPVDSLNSVVAEDNTPARAHRLRHLENCNGDAVHDAMESMVQWAEFCKSKNPGIIYRVDVPDDNDLLSDFLGVEIRPWNTNYNSKRRSKKFNYNRGDILSQNSELVDRFINLCLYFGYEDEASILEIGRIN